MFVYSFKAIKEEERAGDPGWDGGCGLRSLSKCRINRKDPRQGGSGKWIQRVFFVDVNHEYIFCIAVASQQEIADADVLRQALCQESELGRAALDAVGEKKSFFPTLSSLYSSISLACMVNSIRRKLPLSSNMCISYPPSVG